MRKCFGGCHCGKVKFEIEVPDEITVHRCNCSICQKSGYLHLIVAADQFDLLSGEQNLVDYRFHTGVARHLFCGSCGIKSFYVPRSHPDGVSVNVHCLDDDTVEAVNITAFDGSNWEQNVSKLSPISD